MNEPDLARLKAKGPETPDFGDDLEGQIALFVYQKRDVAQYAADWTTSAREQAQKGKAARPRAQDAWKRLMAALEDDPELGWLLQNKGLWPALKEAGRLIEKPAEYHSVGVEGGRQPAPHTLLALWAVDEFFPQWEKNPAPIINAALTRAGIIDTDKTRSIRVTLQNHSHGPQNHKKVPAAGRHGKVANWKPPRQ
jgi:hypothetical protein